MYNKNTIYVGSEIVVENADNTLEFQIFQKFISKLYFYADEIYPGIVL